VILVGLFTPLAYILVLTALVFTPVSYVAPAREISILVGTVMGTRLLDEPDAPRRLVAAGAMVLGVAALAVG
jgi:drug/metabolite transporter (DMT)-like permease